MLALNLKETEGMMQAAFPAILAGKSCRFPKETEKQGKRRLSLTKMRNYWKNKNQLTLFNLTPTYRTEVEEFIDHWNERLWLPKIIKSDRQARMIFQSLQRPFFKENWKEALATVSKSKFLLNKMRNKFTLDFFLDADTFDKIMEGKYTDRLDIPTQSSKTLSQTNRNGDERII